MGLCLPLTEPPHRGCGTKGKPQLEIPLSRGWGPGACGGRRNTKNIQVTNKGRKKIQVLPWVGD